MPLELEETGLDLRSMIQTMWRGKKILLLTMAAGIGLSAYWVYTKTPLYTAEAMIRFVTQEQRVVDLESVVSGISAEGAELNTETMIMTSHRLLGRAIDDLKLLEDAEFVPPVQDETTDQGAAVDVPAPSRWIDAPRVEALNPIRDNAISRLRDKIDVQILPNSYVLSLTVETQDPHKSAAIANALAEIYVESQLEGKFEATRRATVWLSEQVSQLEVALEQAEAAVEEFASATSLVSEQALVMAAQRLKSMRERRRDNLEKQEEIQAQLVELRSLRDETDFSVGVPDFLDPQTKRLAQQIVEASSTERREALKSGFDTRLDAQITQAEAQLVTLARQAETLQAAIDEGGERNDARSDDMIALRQLQREAEATKLLYQHFLARMKETSVQEGVQQADSEVFAWAIPPTAPSYPKLTSSIAKGGLLSLMLGGALVFLFENLNRRLRTPEELEEIGRAPVMAVMPNAPGKAPLDYVIDRPSSSVAEAIRNLRTSVLLSNLDNAPQVIMVTSSLPSEGKTTNSLMLARLTAQMGKKTIAIEGDIRRPKFRSHLEGKKGFSLFSGLRGGSEPESTSGPGLLSLLSGKATLEEAIYTDDKTGLDIIFAQTSKANSADIFSSERFATFIKDLRETYEFIIIDTPPMLLVPDARIIAQLADAVLYAVRWNHTTRDQVRSGVKLLSQGQVPVTGFMLTRVDARKIQTYGYSGYGYSGGTGYYTN